MDGDGLVGGVGEPAGGGEHLVDGALSDAGDLPQPIGARREHGAHGPQSALLDAAQPQPSLGDVLQPGDRNGVEFPPHRGVVDRRQNRPYRLDGPAVVADHVPSRLVQPRSPRDHVPLRPPHAPRPFLAVPASSHHTHRPPTDSDKRPTGAEEPAIDAEKSARSRRPRPRSRRSDRAVAEEPTVRSSGPPARRLAVVRHCRLDHVSAPGGSAGSGPAAILPPDPRTPFPVPDAVIDVASYHLRHTASVLVGCAATFSP